MARGRAGSPGTILLISAVVVLHSAFGSASLPSLQLGNGAACSDDSSCGSSQSCVQHIYGMRCACSSTSQVVAGRDCVEYDQLTPDQVKAIPTATQFTDAPSTNRRSLLNLFQSASRRPTVVLYEDFVPWNFNTTTVALVSAGWTLNRDLFVQPMASLTSLDVATVTVAWISSPVYDCDPWTSYQQALRAFVNSGGILIIDAASNCDVTRTIPVTASTSTAITTDRASYSNLGPARGATGQLATQPNNLDGVIGNRLSHGRLPEPGINSIPADAVVHLRDSNNHPILMSYTIGLGFVVVDVITKENRGVNFTASVRVQENFIRYIVLWSDRIPPTISPKADITEEASSAAGAVVVYTPPSTSDGVDGAGVAICSPASNTQFAMGPTTVTCRATDAAGNAAEPTTFTVTVRDTTKPVIAAAANVGPAAATSADGADVTYTAPTTTDAVDGDGVATCTPASGTTFPLGTTTVTCTKSDAAGNVATPVTFNVIVTDQTPPSIADANDVAGGEAVSPEGRRVEYEPPVWVDDVDGTGSASCSPASGTWFGVGDTDVTCTATDGAGNAATPVTFTVTVEDTIAPAINQPVGVNEEATSPSGAVVTYISPFWTDVVDVGGEASCTPASGSTFPLGPTTVTCTAQDSAGNDADAKTFAVVVVDTTAPEVDGAPDVVEEATSFSGAAVTYTSPTWTDAVAGSGSATCTPASGSTFPLGPTTVTCTAEDEAGNDATPVTFTVTVDDTTGPVITTPADDTMEGNTLGGAVYSYTTPTATDAADPGMIEVRCEPESGTLFPVGTTPVTCDARDWWENAATPVTFAVTVTDTTKPVIAPHDPVDASADSSSGATVSYELPSWTDTVDGEGDASCTPASGTTFPLGPTTVTCTAEDEAGNAADPVTFTVTVTDTAAPVIMGPEVETAEATSPTDTVVEYTVITEDNVDGPGLANCVPPSGSAFTLGTHAVTCSATDAAGNAAEIFEFTVAVVDTTGPTLDTSVLSDRTVEAASSAGARVTYQSPLIDDIVDGATGLATCTPASGSVFPLGVTTVTCTAIDDAGNEAESVTFTVTVEDSTRPVILPYTGDSVYEATSRTATRVDYTVPSTSDTVDGPGVASCRPVAGSEFSMGSTDVTCWALDAAGNEAELYTFVIQVLDRTPPSIDPVDPVTFEATGTSTPVSYVPPIAVDFVDGAVEVLCFPAPGTPMGLGVHEIQCEASDSSGNPAATVTIEVTVEDTVAPDITAPGDITVDATSRDGASEVTYTPPTWTDSVAGSGEATCTPPSGGPFPMGPTTVTCTAPADQSGNTAVPVTFTVTVTDLTAPEIDTPEDVVREATSPDGAVVVFTPPSWHDTVDGTGQAQCDAPSGEEYSLGEHLVTCTTEDAAGNPAAAVTFFIIVQDTQGPEIEDVSDFSAEATSPLGAAVTYESPTTMDVVDGAGVASCSPPSGSTFALGPTTVTCRARDARGNAAEPLQFTVTVVDTTRPIIAFSVVEATSADGAEVVYTAPATYDAVDGQGVASCTPASGTIFPLGPTVIECTAADDTHENAGMSFSFAVTVVDTTSPVIATPRNIRTEATSSSGVEVFYRPPLVNDAVGGSTTASCSPASGATFPLGATTVTCTSPPDAAGNTVEPVTFVVTVVDTTPPVIAAMVDLDGDATSASGAEVTYGPPSTSDAVDGASEATCDPPRGGVFPLGTHSVTCTAVDAAGNPAEAITFTVTVRDNAKPVIAPADDVTAEASSASGAVVNYTPPSFSDAVDGSGTATCTPPSGTSFYMGSTTVRCTAQDASNNVADAVTFAVIVQDNTAPVLAPADDVTEQAASADGAVVTYTAPTTTDAVDGDGVASCTPASGSTFPLGTTTVTCTAPADRAANVPEPVTFTVTVVDTVGPVVGEVPDMTVEATGPGGAEVTYTPPTTTDAVDGTGPASCTPSGGEFEIGTHTITCTADPDQAGNPATPSTFTITVTDTTKPVIGAVEDISKEAASATGATVNYMPPTTSDIVDGETGVASCSPGSGRFAVGVHTITCTAEDAAGNPADPITFTITVTDTTKPEISAPVDIGPVDATSPSGAMVTYDAPTTTDVVDGEGEASCTPASGSTFPLGTTTVTCTAEDEAGNAATPATFTVTVHDVTAPVIAAPEPATITLEATSADGAPATFENPVWSDAVDVSGSAVCDHASGDTFPLGTTTVTCTSEDEAGNDATPVTFTVVVEDTTAPLIAPRAGLTVEATSAAGAVVTYSSPTTSDAVDAPGLASCTPASDQPFPLGDTTVTCTAADQKGNVAAPVTFTVSVMDTRAPVISWVSPITVLRVEATSRAATLVSYSPPSWFDAVDGTGEATCTPASGSTFRLGNTTVTCSRTDAAGNVARAVTFRVSVVDTTAPVLTPPAIPALGYIRLGAVSPAGVLVNYTALTSTDAVDGVMGSNCTPVSGRLQPVGFTTITCNKRDTSGNMAVPVSFTFRVVRCQWANNTFWATASNGITLGWAMGGDYGVATLLDPGYPRLVPNLAAGAPAGSPTVEATDSLLVYDAATQRYTLTWRPPSTAFGIPYTLEVRLSTCETVRTYAVRL